MIKMYSNGCPKCNILKKKLNEKNIQYEECNDTEIIKAKGIQFLPVLEINGDLLDFKQATEWIGRN
jgi:glutaredoxin